MQPGPERIVGGGWRVAAVPLGLVGLCVFIYGATIWFPFVNWDDPEYVFDNPIVRQGLSWASVSWAFASRVSGNWHPLTMLSHLLDVNLYGLQAGGHHATSVAIHIANAILLFLVWRALTGAMWRSAFVAAIFAVHPLHVESVAWIAERKDVLSTFFVLITLLAYAAYARRPSVSRYAAVVLAFVAGLLSKPMVVTLPGVLLLLDIWPLGRIKLLNIRETQWALVLGEKIPLFLAATAVALVTLSVQGSAVASLDALPWTTRAANAITGYVEYIGKAIWPWPLAAFYPMRPVDRGFVAVSAVVLSLATLASLFTARRRPYLLVGWAWFLITLAPVIGLVQTGEQAMADRYMYFPLVGLTVMLAWGATEAVGRSGSNRRLLAGAGITVVVACAITARAQTRTWSSSASLWRHAIGATRDNYRAWEKLAEAERDAGQLDAAYDDYTRALALAPPASPRYRAIVQNSQGIVRARQHRPEDAIPHFAESVRLDPRFSEAQSNFASSLATVGRLEEAAQHFELALRLTPDSVEAQLGLGGVRLTQGRPQQALAQYSAAVSARPDLAAAQSGLGAADAALGRRAEAYTALFAAIRLDPGLTSARVRLANLLAAEGRDGEAIVQLEQAVKSDEVEPSWQYGLGLLLLRQGRRNDARSAFSAALALDPGFVDAREALRELGG